MLAKRGWILGAVWMAVAAIEGHAETVARTRELFLDPPREYSSAPLWVWNDALTEEQVRECLRDLAGQGIRQAFVHPRPGLMTPYLSEEWFRLWRAALDEARKLDMNLWIYDENSYPSGFAGGHVPEAMPESRGQGIELREEASPPALSEEVVAVYRETEGGVGFENIADRLRAGETFPEGKHLTVLLRRADPSPWFGNRFYVDLLRPGVTEKFLELTLEPYRRELGEEFGKRIPGSFTDEPHLRPAGVLHWTPDLPEAFERRWGYSLLDHLPSLFRDVGDCKRVRHNYYQLLLDLLVERWAKPYHDYCERHGLEFTGHYWEHTWPNTTVAPDNMAMYAWHQRPAIDMLFNQPFDEGAHAQVGNVRAVLELSSVANQLGIPRTLCETYGGGGWDMRFEDMKRIGDWIFALGVNTMNEHLSHVTIRGARKGDYPPTFSYHSPWWDSYRVLVQYYKRLSVALSHGQQVNDVLLLEPTTTVWCYQGGNRDRREAIGAAFQKLVIDLAEAQVEFDLGSEDIVADHGSVSGETFVVGKRAYRTVVLPPMTENLNGRTAELLAQYASNGGAIIACGDSSLDRVDGQASDALKGLANSPSWKRMEPAELIESLAKAEGRTFAVRRAEGSSGRLYHHRRRFDDGELVFLCNASPEESSAGSVVAEGAGVMEWDLDTGEERPYAFTVNEGRVEAPFELPPAGSLLLFVSKTNVEPAAPMGGRMAVGRSGPFEVRREELNVLTLDFMDVTAGGETLSNVYQAAANRFVWRKHGFEEDPWDHAVQYKDEIVSRDFAEDSGFEVTYRFTIAEAVPETLEAVVERPDLYAIACNGTEVSARPGEWWLDRQFGRIDLRGAAKVGENTITLTARPFTVFHEVQPVYVRGSFALNATDRGFAIVPERPLAPGPWKHQGMPFYGHGVVYSQRFIIDEAQGRFTVELPSWYGSVAKVRVNGKDAGVIYHQPFECDVTQHVVAGENTVEVTVIGTLKNTLGPHHGEPPLGIASPDMFRRGPDSGPPPGVEYSTVGYGLFQPFALVREDYGPGK